MFEKFRLKKLKWQKYQTGKLQKAVEEVGQAAEVSPGDKVLKENFLAVDVHAHPALKMNFPVVHLTIPGVRPMGYRQPTSLRTSFNRLNDGGVRLLTSGVVAGEDEFVDDLKRWSGKGFALRLIRLSHAGQKSTFDWTRGQFDNVERRVDRYNNSLWRTLTNTYWRPSNPLPEAIVARNYAEVKQALAAGKITLVHSIEGAHSIEGPLTKKYWRDDNEPFEAHKDEVRGEIRANLDECNARGVAIIGLGHYYPNVIAGTTFGYPQSIARLVRGKRWKWAWRDANRGLTEIGREFVEWMVERKMIIDVAHVSPIARAEVYEIVRRVGGYGSVIASHVGAYALNPDSYNLKDDEIKTIADLGGLVGVFFSNYWLVGHDGSDLGINWLVNTIHHFVKVGGMACVGLGTDFDGFSDPPDDLVDASELPRLAHRLLIEGFSPDDIRAIMGGNALRVLKDGWH